MWENKVIIWCLPKYSKEEWETLSANESDIATVTKHLRGSGRALIRASNAVRHASMTCCLVNSLSIRGFHMPHETYVVLT